MAKKVSANKKSSEKRANAEAALSAVREEFQARTKIFVDEFAGESDRAAVILGAAKLDTLLYQLLQLVLLPVTGNRDDLLDGDSGLGTFSSRIHACYRLGLIDARITQAMHLIRKIRNSFAHETSTNSLSTGAHRDRIRELVAELSRYEDFHRVKSVFFAELEGPTTDFRTALALLMIRLERAIHTAVTFDGADATDLIPPTWKRINHK